MYFDNLTNVSLLAFAITFGSPVYACILRGRAMEWAGYRRETGLDLIKTIALTSR